MRIARVNTAEGPRFGQVHAETIDLLDGSPLASAQPRKVGEVPLRGAELLVPTQPSKILAVGRNYAAHAQEVGLDLGAEPSVFLKPPSSLLDPGGDVVLPDPALGPVEHEAELAVVIGRRARHVARADALSYVFGYTCSDDVSARALQRSDPHITRAKGFDTFCPLGPWVETDLDPLDVRITCAVNGELRQSGHTSEQLFDLPTVIAYLSSWTTLLPGDVVLTGSPAGSQALRPGDQVAIEIQGIGVLRHGVVAGPAPAASPAS